MDPRDPDLRARVVARVCPNRCHAHVVATERALDALAEELERHE